MESGGACKSQVSGLSLHARSRPVGCCCRWFLDSKVGYLGYHFIDPVKTHTHTSIDPISVIIIMARLRNGDLIVCILSAYLRMNNIYAHI